MGAYCLHLAFSMSVEYPGVVVFGGARIEDDGEGARAEAPRA